MSQVPGQSPTSYGLSDYAAVLRCRWGWIIVGLAVGLGAGYVVNDYISPRYVSHASVIVEPTGLTTTSLVGGRTSGDINLDTEAQLVRSNEVATRVQEELGARLSTTELVERVTITVPPNSQVLTIGYEAETPAAAQRGASAFSAAYLASRGELAKADIDAGIAQVDEEISALSGTLADVVDRLSELDDLSPERPLIETQQTLLIDQISTLNQERVKLSRLEYRPGRIITAADLPDTPTGLGQRAVYAGVVALGLLLGLGLLLLRERTDQRLLSVNNATYDTGLRFIGGVPPVEPWGATPGKQRVAYERLRNVLASITGRHRVMLMSGVDNRTPVDSVSETLAVFLAATGRRVVLIDTRMSNGAGEVGLSDVLENGEWDLVELPERADAQNRPAAHLRIDAGTRPDVLHDQLASATAQAAFTELRRLVDVTLVVGPPDDAISQTLATLCDGVLHVAVRRRSRRPAIVASVQRMTQVEARSVGLVVVDHPPRAVWAYKALAFRLSQARARRAVAAAARAASAPAAAATPDIPVPHDEDAGDVETAQRDRNPLEELMRERFNGTVVDFSEGFDREHERPVRQHPS